MDFANFHCYFIKDFNKIAKLFISILKIITPTLTNIKKLIEYNDND